MEKFERQVGMNVQKNNHHDIKEDSSHDENIKGNTKHSNSDIESESEDESEIVAQSDDEETKEKKKQEALKQELFTDLPKHCKAYIPQDINPKKREPKPPRNTTPEECFVSCPKIIPRSEWGADMPKKRSEQMMYRVRPAIFLETDGTRCDSQEDCAKILTLMQRLQMDLLKYDDISFSFLIGEDGTIYEGRGWGYENEKAGGFAGIGYIGSHTLEPLDGPSDAMLQATYDLIMCGVTKGFLYNPFSTGAFSGETPIEMVQELMKHSEDIDYRTRPEDVGLDDDD